MRGCGGKSQKRESDTVLATSISSWAAANLLSGPKMLMHAVLADLLANDGQKYVDSFDMRWLQICCCKIALTFGNGMLHDIDLNYLYQIPKALAYSRTLTLPI